MRVAAKQIHQAWRGAVLLFAAGILMLPAMTALAQQTGGVGGRVANPDPENPRSQSIFIYTLDRGESKKDQLVVSNPTDEEQTITLGSVDGVVTNTGDYTCRQAAEPVEGSGGWVQLAKTQLILPAGAEEKVDFIVTVPENADVGEHNSCLTIQIDPAEDDGEEVSPGVRLRTRQAIRMVVTIPGDLKRELSIASFTVYQGNDEQRYTFTAANDGNVSADIDMRVRLVAYSGREVANIGGEYPIVPGENLTKEFTSNLRPMFGGRYTATPSIRFDKRLGAFGTQNEQAEYEIITGEPRTMFFWPTLTGWAVISATIVLLVVALWLTVRRIKSYNRLKSSTHPHTVKPGETLQTLAEETGTEWEDIAKLNDLSAPYSLIPGQTIQLPGRHRDSGAPNMSEELPEDMFAVRPMKRGTHAETHHAGAHKKSATDRRKTQ